MLLPPHPSFRETTLRSVRINEMGTSCRKNNQRNMLSDESSITKSGVRLQTLSLPEHGANLDRLGRLHLPHHARGRDTDASLGPFALIPIYSTG